MTTAENPSGARLVCGIPVRNLWLLMLYASPLFRELAIGKTVAVEDNPDEIPDLAARILCRRVERRIRRNLHYGYRTREAELHRVRGRIDLLTTERRGLPARGRVACRFEELTADTARNRYVRAALESVASRLADAALARHCRTLAATLRRMGVVGERPGRGEAAAVHTFGRHDADDRPMVAAARLAFDLSLPAEEAGTRALSAPDRDVHWLRRLFEKGVAGLYDVILPPLGWRVRPGACLRWPVADRTPGMDAILPQMYADIILDHPASGRRVVIDTKFNRILAKSRYREASLRSGYLYQIYAYLRSQEGADPLADTACGLLLHPAVDGMLDERIVIQNHAVRFATVDLTAKASDIRARLEAVIA